MIKYIESDLFANLCQLFSAIGTVGAVIISLVMVLKQNRIKTTMTATTVNTVPFNGTRKGLYISGYSVTICNLSNCQNIYLKQGLYCGSKRFNKKAKKANILIPIVEVMKIFPFKEALGPGEEYTFFISETQIKGMLKEYNDKKIKVYFLDKFNREYVIKLEREELKKELEYNDKSGNKIVAL